jgi:hypothetical protein
MGIYKQFFSFVLRKHLERFEVFTAVAMKNAFSWDLKTLFVSHGKHIMSL